MENVAAGNSTPSKIIERCYSLPLPTPDRPTPSHLWPLFSFLTALFNNIYHPATQQGSCHIDLATPLFSLFYCENHNICVQGQKLDAIHDIRVSLSWYLTLLSITLLILSDQQFLHYLLPGTLKIFSTHDIVAFKKMLFSPSSFQEPLFIIILYVLFHYFIKITKINKKIAIGKFFFYLKGEY